MINDSSTECWNNVGNEWVQKAQSNDFRIYYIMPNTIEKMGDVKGLRVLDLGCGDAGYAREFAKRGADVTAIDCAEESIAFAKSEAERQNLKMECLVRNSNDLYGIEDNTFDIVLCSMMLMDVEDLDGTIKEVNRVLKPNCRVVISVLHPCFKSPIEHKWQHNGDETYVVVKNYFEPQAWSGVIDGIQSPVIYRHRTISDYTKCFIHNGFEIVDMDEPRPTEEQMNCSPRIKWLDKIPM